MRIATYRLIFVAFCLFWFPAETCAQGETTSAIVGQVTDSTGAGIPGATVTIANHASGARRAAKTDDEGRFNFPQLQPGAYSIKVEAAGFEPQQNDAVSAGLGQKQTVDFVLKVAQAKQTVEVSGTPPLVNPGECRTHPRI